MKHYEFTFDPRMKGLRKFLGKLESEIMELVWRKGETSVREVHETLAAKRDLAYTTVMTVMSRLSEKGLLEKRKEGHAFIYSPTATRDEFTRSLVGRIMNGLLDEFTSPAISQFVESIDREDPEKIDELARLIERKRRKKKDV